MEKVYKYPAALILSFAFFTSCQKKEDPKPQPASVVDSYVHQSAPGVVNFQNLSTSDFTSFSWSFGNGKSSNAANPSTLYTQGIYTVTLFGSGSTNSSATKTIAVTTGDYFSAIGYSATTITASKNDTAFHIVTKDDRDEFTAEGNPYRYDFTYEMIIPKTATEGQILDITSSPANSRMYYHYIQPQHGGTIYKYDQPVEGKITISQVTTAEISGTFSCTLYRVMGDSLTFKEGKFKVKLD
jgi:PKD repeat protein